MVSHGTHKNVARAARVLSLSIPGLAELFYRIGRWLAGSRPTACIRETAPGSVYTATSASSGQSWYAPNYWRARRYHFRDPSEWGEHLVEKYQLSNYLTEGCVLIDIGANTGELSVAALKGGANVIALEPDPRAHAALLLNTASWDSSAQIHLLAAASKAGDLTFWMATDGGDSSAIRPMSRIFQKSVMTTVQAVTCDALYTEASDFIANRPILLKVEAEGYEPEVLDGAAEVLQRCRFVTIDAGPEREGKPTIEACVRILSQHGLNVRVTGNIVTAAP